MTGLAEPPRRDRFVVSRGCFEEMLVWLDGGVAGGLSHAELETQLDVKGRELLRRLYQEHLDLRTVREARVEVIDAHGTVYGTVEGGHHRTLATIFGTVDVDRFAYRHRGCVNLHPADAVLNLPTGRHSHGLRRLAAIESARGSFDAATEAIERSTGVMVGKRQVEELTTKAAVDVEDFYATFAPEPGVGDDALVLSCDGKGIVMRPDALRPATEKAAAVATTKLKTRLSKGEKRYRKRMAEVGAVYDLTPVTRTATDVMASGDDQAIPPPSAHHKWVTASVADDAAVVVARVFDEAERRDPDHQRDWVALVDGNNHQLDRIHAEAHSRDVNVVIIIDVIHVLEYLWGAVWCFFDEGDPAAEAWVRDKARSVLEGNATHVAAGIRRWATTRRLPLFKRDKADACATYLTNKAPYLDYPTALANGWPIATGVIEGTCRYLVADRMDITGARWSVNGAEAILKLRALRANGDLDTYWQYHLNQERQRIHQSRYTNSLIPAAA